MNGLGNAFVIMDLRGVPYGLDGDSARLVANPATGPGCDQVITLEDCPGGVLMGVWNADGSSPDVCGNAARCVGWLLMKEKDADTVVFLRRGGTVRAFRAGDMRVGVDMGVPAFAWRDIPLSGPVPDTLFLDAGLFPFVKVEDIAAVSMGNPHCIFFVDDVRDLPPEHFGARIEKHSLFPERVNVSVVAVTGKDTVRVRVWERGAGLTKACGSAACAVAVAACRRGFTGRRVVVRLDGGDLVIEWRKDDGHVIMEGDVDFEGEYRLSFAPGPPGSGTRRAD